MKTKMKLMSMVLGTALLCTFAFAKDKAAKKDAKGADAAMSAEMMQKWTAYSTPGAAHRALEPLVGSFSHTTTWWMDAKSKPETSAGTTDSKWILGGRFVESMVSGTSMGQPFEGRGIMGYDNEKKQYDSVWIDSMATGMMVGHGQYDAASMTFTESSSASCPLEGTKMFRCVTKITDVNNHTFEMYTNGKDGKEFLMMKIVYVRKA